jgi:hypothetical protein
MADSAITFTSGEVSTYYAARVPGLKQRRAAEWRGACPIHHGKNENLAVEPDTKRGSVTPPPSSGFPIACQNC